MRGRGRGRGRGGHPPRRPPPTIQPYISDELQSINMELQLLREKKNMIEKQHQMLQDNRGYNQFQGQYSAVQPPLYEDDIYDAPGSSRQHRNHSHFDDNYATQNYIPPNRGKKRRSENWAGPAPKRFSAPDGNVVQSFGPRLGPRPNTSTPNSTKKYEFRRPTGPKKPKKEDEMMLLPDREPSVKLRGRLQLALGHILKKMKEHFADQEKYYAMLFVHPYLNNIKMDLRKRIANVMMNKMVARPEDVEELYRKRYPVESDVLFLKKISREVASTTTRPDILSENVISAPVNPGVYRNSELPLLIDAELEEVFRKLEIMYDPNLDDITKAYRLAHNKITSNFQAEFIPEEEKTDEVVAWKAAVQEKIHKMVPRILLKNANHITKLLKMEMIYVNTCTNVVNQNNETGDSDEINLEITDDAGGMPQFCARVRGEPRLPITTVMRPFLNQFNPVWVKKKKMARNVLFVAFRDEESLKKLLQKDGHDFGTCFVKIGRMHTHAKKEKKQPTKRIKPRKDSNHQLDEHDTSANLTDQINDLNSSIRQAHDEETNASEGEASKEDGTDELDKESGGNEPTEGADKPQSEGEDVIDNVNDGEEQNNDTSKTDAQGDKQENDEGKKDVENVENSSTEVNEGDKTDKENGDATTTATNENNDATGAIVDTVQAN